jgi:hypothetical protein
MGHTIPPFTMQFNKERRCFNQMQRGLLLKEDKRLFKELWDAAEFHISACEKAGHPLPMISILVAMNLEQQKSIYRLKEQNRGQNKAINELQSRLKEKEVDNIVLESQIGNLRKELEERLKIFREELLDIKYAEYVS